MQTTRTTTRRPWITYTVVTAGGLAALAAIGAWRSGAGAATVKDGAGVVLRPASPPSPTLSRATTPPPATTTPPPPAASAPTPAAPVQVAQAKRPEVEVVFAIDTTGSMSGLLEGAKRKIWSIASFISKGQPTPDLRVGLVAYRDKGDAYVTKVFDLDTDLDRVYQRLLRLRADGGGDTPEHVARALDESVNKMSWSKGQDVLRLIYLVGDAPAHTDYDDGYTLAKATRAAAAKGIQVHAIRCGNDPETETQWRKVAMLGNGQFLTIGQDGGMREDRTPYDEELARLHDEVSHTVVTYGAKGRAARAALDEADRAPAPVKAARATFFARKRAAVGGGGDLVEGFASGEVALDKVSADDLPTDMKALSAGERKAKLEHLVEERNEAQARIETLSRKRDDYLAVQSAAASARPVGEPTAAHGSGRMARPAASRSAGVAAALEPAPAAAPSFDDEVAKTVVSGAKKIGVKY